jgi:hypothetical protein
MCMEDMAISMALTKRTENASVGAAATSLVEADPTRYAMIIATDGTGLIWVDSDPNVKVGQGLPIKVGDHPLILCAAEFGDWVKSGLWAIGAVAGPTAVGMLITDFVPERFKQAVAYLKEKTK